jgi:hypothetical protein
MQDELLLTSWNKRRSGWNSGLITIYLKLKRLRVMSPMMISEQYHEEEKHLNISDQVHE